MRGQLISASSIDTAVSVCIRVVVDADVVTASKYRSPITVSIDSISSIERGISEFSVEVQREDEGVGVSAL